MPKPQQHLRVCCLEWILVLPRELILFAAPPGQTNGTVAPKPVEVKPEVSSMEPPQAPQTQEPPSNIPSAPNGTSVSASSIPSVSPYLNPCASFSNKLTGTSGRQ